MAKIKQEYKCSLGLTFDLLGGKWKLRILWHIIHGDNRFSLLLKGISGITEKVLTTQLRELEASALIERKVIQEKPLKVKYNIAPNYKRIEALIDDLCAFSCDYADVNDIHVKD